MQGEDKFKVGEQVMFYDDPVEVVEVEPRPAGGSMYCVEFTAQPLGSDGHLFTWCNENELEKLDKPDEGGV